MTQPRRRLPSLPSFDPYFWIGCVSVLVVGVGLLWSRAGAAAGGSAPTDIPDRLTADLSASGLASHLGRADAPVRVVELFDYQCPACTAAHVENWPLIQRLVAEGALRFTAYDVPLPPHTNAIPAAVAAGCVGSVAPAAFWEYRHRVLSSRGAWEANPRPQRFFVQLAADLGADTAAVRNCMATQGEERARVLAEAWRLARDAGIRYSPAWEVNGKPVRWPEVAREIDAALGGRAR